MPKICRSIAIAGLLILFIPFLGWADEPIILASGCQPAGAVSVSAAAPAGIERTGYGVFYSNTDTSTQDITVPVGTTMLVIFATGYDGADAFSNGFDSFTVEGATLTGAVDGDDSDAFAAVILYKLNPATGAGVTLSWNWGTDGTWDSGVTYGWVAYSGVGGVGDSYAAQNPGTMQTDTMTAASGNMIVVGVFGYAGSELAVATWSNIDEEVTETTATSGADMTVAQKLATGNTQITATSHTYNASDGGIIALVLTP